jgi:hypothetical protein
MSLLLYIFTQFQIPLEIASITAALFFFSVLVSWICYGRKIISLGGLVLAAIYAILKIPIYVRFLVARQVNWVRSKRD